MARNGLDDIAGIKDPLLLYNFSLIIPNVPGGGDGLALTLRCNAATIPGKQIEPVLVQLRGLELQFAGRDLYEHNFQATYLETRDIVTRKSLLRWSRKARDFRGRYSGSYKSEYATQADLELYDDVGNVVSAIRMYGFFPLNVDSLQTESGSSTAAMYPVTFSYDWFEDISGE